MGRVAAVLILIVTLVGCGSNASAGTPKLTSVTVAMGYFPNVQFAPFYVAVARNYYRSAGLDVHFQYGIEPDLLALASRGKVDLVVAGGDEVLAAAAQGLHVQYVMTQYSRFPSALFSLKSTGITSPKSLRGHSIGVPGRYGASWVGLLVLLQKAGLSQSAVSVMTIGFSQLASVSQKKVDAAVGYAMNEPVELRSTGTPVNEIDVYRYANLAGAGIAAGDGTLKARPSVVRAFVQATLHGMRDALNDPAYAFRVSEATVKQIRAQATVQRAVLQRCLAFWRAEAGHPLGWIDPAVWRSTASALYRYGQIKKPVSPTKFYTESFIPGA